MIFCRDLFSAILQKTQSRITILISIEPLFKFSEHIVMAQPLFRHKDHAVEPEVCKFRTTCSCLRLFDATITSIASSPIFSISRPCLLQGEMRHKKPSRGFCFLSRMTDWRSSRIISCRRRLLLKRPSLLSHAAAISIKT